MSSLDRFVETNGIRLHYLDYPGDEPALILLHGLTANCHSFDGLVQSGLSPRFRVIAPDLRGRGESDQPSAGYSMPDHAADIVGLLDALHLDRVVLVGHSFGGFLSMYIAAHYPERVSHLVILDSGFAMASTQTRDQIKPALDRLGQVWPSWDAYLSAIKQAPYYGGWWDPAIEGYYRADVRTDSEGNVQARARPESIAAAMDGVQAEPWTEHVASIQQPALLLNAPGGYGPPGSPPILVPEAAHETVRAFADGRYRQIPGNHMTMLFGSGAQQIVDAIMTFVPATLREAGDDV